MTPACGAKKQNTASLSFQGFVFETSLDITLINSRVIFIQDKRICALNIPENFQIYGYTKSFQYLETIRIQVLLHKSEPKFYEWLLIFYC